MSDVPSGLARIQIEGLSFRSPVSESQVQTIGSTINGLLDDKIAQEARFATDEANISTLFTRASNIVAFFVPVGTVFPTLLSESQFQSEIAAIGFAITGTSWILADGRGVGGSRYQTITGRSSVPDLRGIFLRGRDYGRGADDGGDLPVGTFSAHRLTEHKHEYVSTLVRASTPPGYTTVASFVESPPGRVVAERGDQVVGNPVFVGGGGSVSGETSPRSVTVNYMIRIN